MDTSKEQLESGLLELAETEQDAKSYQIFVGQITDAQASQILKLNGFTESYKIPIWNNELGGPPRDASRKHDTPPDDYIEGTTEPCMIIKDLSVILFGIKSLEEAQSRIEALTRMNTMNPQYWRRLSAILGKPPRGILQENFLPILSGKGTSAITESSSKKGIIVGNELVIHNSSGTLRVTDIDNYMGGIGTSAKKLFDIARVYLARINYYKGNAPRQTVEINLIDYWNATKSADIPMTKDRLKDFKRSIKKDLDALGNVKVDFTESTQDYKSFRFISSHSIQRNIITINFDIEAARYLVKAYIGQYPTALLRHDNKNPNSYAIGLKISLHHNMYNNRTNGTENTLGVRSLLQAAPEIPTYEDLEKRNARNWKDKIKKPLENSLDDNVNPPVNYLKKWEYRDPVTGQTYTREEAQRLTWESYRNLMVDFIVANEPDELEQRRLEYTAKKEAYARNAGTEKKKRGRPKKEGGMRGTS